MKANHLKVFAVAAVLSAAGWAVAGTDADQSMLKEIAGYRQWTRLTMKPLVVIDASFAG